MNNIKELKSASISTHPPMVESLTTIDVGYFGQPNCAEIDKDSWFFQYENEYKLFVMHGGVRVLCAEFAPDELSDFIHKGLNQPAADISLTDGSSSPIKFDISTAIGSTSWQISYTPSDNTPRDFKVDIIKDIESPLISYAFSSDSANKLIQFLSQNLLWSGGRPVDEIFMEFTGIQTANKSQQLPWRFEYDQTSQNPFIRPFSGPITIPISKTEISELISFVEGRFTTKSEKTTVNQFIEFTINSDSKNTFTFAYPANENPPTSFNIRINVDNGEHSGGIIPVEFAKRLCDWLTALPQ